MLIASATAQLIVIAIAGAVKLKYALTQALFLA